MGRPTKIEELKIRKTTFYRYKEKIRQQDKEAWLETAKESLESAALKVKKSLDYCTKIARDIANDNSQDAKARLEAAKKVVECSITYYRMLEKGPTSKTIATTITKLEEEQKDVTDRRMESLDKGTFTT
jgi:hypothetical protein